MSEELPGLDFVPAETYVIESLEELRAIAHPLRIQILDFLISAPHTVQAIRKALGIDSTKLYYHVAELEKVGLIRLIHTEVQSGIQLKYYRAVANYFYLSSALLHVHEEDRPVEASGEYLAAQLESMVRDFRKAFIRGFVGRHPDQFLVSRRVLRSTPERAAEIYRLAKQLDDLCRQADNCEGELTMEFGVAIFPLQEPVSSPQANDQGSARST